MIVSNFHIILNAFQRQTYLLFDSAVHKWATPDVDCIYSWVRALTSVVKKQNPCGYSLYVMLHKSSCQFTISKGLSLEFAQIYQTCHFINFIILNIQYCCNIFIGEWLYQLYIYKNIQKKFENFIYSAAATKHKMHAAFLTFSNNLFSWYG